jgi:hypothetical protein
MGVTTFPHETAAPESKGRQAVDSSKTIDRIFVLLGFLWILIGCLINGWTLEEFGGISARGPLSRPLLHAWTVGWLSWGIISILLFRLKSIRHANMLVVSTIAALLSMEYTVHYFPLTLGHGFANGLRSKYSTRRDGIYYRDPVLDMWFMRPNHRTEMYYNGYVWRHETDGDGFRNREARDQADVMLLGDSFVYGHGVEIDQTIGYFIEELSGKSVVNLGQQGDTCMQESYKLTSYVTKFNPHYVVYFFYENDLRDLYVYRTTQELEQFAQTPLDRVSFENRMDVQAALELQKQENERSLVSQSFFTQLGEKVYLLKVASWLLYRYRQQQFDESLSNRNHDINDETSLGWRYLKKCIQYMDQVARTHHARFVMAPIIPDNAHHRTILTKTALTHKIPLIDTRGIVSSNPRLFLSGDGHFSPHGAKAMAELVSDFLKTEDVERVN